MPRTRATGGCGVINGKIYLVAGLDTEPVANPAIYWTVMDVFDPQAGLPPRILAGTIESTNRFRLAWRGEVGRNYAVESTPDVAKGPWTRILFSTGTDSVRATNALVEAATLLSPADTNRFFRVLETN
jgi:hypothetical protein